jgi:hypothetical protein
MTFVRRRSAAVLDRFEVNVASTGQAGWGLTLWTIQGTRSPPEERIPQQNAKITF